LIPESQLYSFLHEEDNFVVHFLEGQKLIVDMATIHQKHGYDLVYFRDCILSAQPIISFLKAGESVGLYIDNEEPYFRFKLETGANGLTRFLLLPKSLDEIPKTLLGKGRLTKIFPGTHLKPYTSIIEVSGMSVLEVVNHVLSHSYQVDSSVYLATESDQSVMITRLPPINVNKNELKERPSINAYYLQKKKFLTDLFKEGLTDNDEILKAFESEGFTMINKKKVKFFCPCSKEKMILGIMSLNNQNPDTLFDKNQSEIETECDYCHTKYIIQRSDLRILQ